MALLAALAVVFGNASGTQQVADQAIAAQHIEATLGSLASFRTTLGQTLLVAEASPESRALPVLIDDALLLSSQLETRLMAASGALEAVGVDADIDPTAVLTTTGAMLEALATGNAQAAGDRAIDVAAELDLLTMALAVPREELIASVSAAGQQAGRVSTAARFMVALGIPGAALLSWAAIARRRRKREQMQFALEQERELNRSKDQLIANISHELRTPLTGIYAAARTLNDAGDSDRDLAHELTGVIVEQSTELTRMVEDLLVSAQVGVQRLALTLTAVSVENAVDGIVDEFARTRTTVGSECEPGWVVADPLRLRQILRNLVSNARNHGGATIWIEGANTSAGYRLAVADDGGGVPEEIEDRLFTPFVHQGDAPLITGSVGLGLSISRLLAKAMGGSVAYLRDATTTRFIVELPSPPNDPRPTPLSESDDESNDETSPAIDSVR
ncbi:MAG: HAMP domain-containing histidine kinase [Acidimicrobiia bacterium]|nr:HAMP domain-containing histidine kinase [Acidimicrobiia bacterium]